MARNSSTRSLKAMISVGQTNVLEKRKKIKSYPWHCVGPGGYNGLLTEMHKLVQGCTLDAPGCHRPQRIAETWGHWGKFLTLIRLKIERFQLNYWWMQSYPAKFKSFQPKIVQMGALQELQNFKQTLVIFVSTQSTQTLYLGWYLRKSYQWFCHFPPPNTSSHDKRQKTLQFSWSFIWMS